MFNCDCKTTTTINAMEVNTTDNFTEHDVDMQKLQESVRLPSQKVKVT